MFNRYSVCCELLLFKNLEVILVITQMQHNVKAIFNKSTKQEKKSIDTGRIHYKFYMWYTSNTSFSPTTALKCATYYVVRMFEADMLHLLFLAEKETIMENKKTSKNYTETRNIKFANELSKQQSDEQK